MEQFNNTLLLFAVKKNYKQLLIICIVAAVSAAFFSSSYFITPKFKSIAIIYPSNVAPYSNESQTEQMVQLLQSADIRDKIIDSLDLYAHYGIDKNYELKKSAINYEFSENVSISKTEFESIEISVLDEEPKMSAKMVALLIALVDKKIHDIQKQKAYEVVLVNKKVLNAISNRADSLDSLLKSYSKNYGILDYEIQTKEAQRAYFSGIEKNSTKSQLESKQLLTNLAEHGHTFLFLSNKLEVLKDVLQLQETEYFNALRVYEKTFTYSNIVSKPIVADKKSYPVRWIIVLMSTVAALFLGILFLFATNKKEN